jgi:hypothetical protein
MAVIDVSGGAWERTVEWLAQQRAARRPARQDRTTLEA